MTLHSPVVKGLIVRNAAKGRQTKGTSRKENWNIFLTNNFQFHYMGDKIVSDSQVILSPDRIPVLSKATATGFHQSVRQLIYDTGNGLFEYVETVKFMAALNDQIFGNSSSKIEPDKEFINYLREQITQNGEKSIYKSQRGVKFENAETGTSYDFSKCADPILAELEAHEAEAREAVKARREFLKNVPAEGLEILQGDELIKIFPPSKSSKSSVKVSLPKG